MPDTVAFLTALMAIAGQAAAPAFLQPPPLAGAPMAGYPHPVYASAGAVSDTSHAQECYAKVKFGAQYGVAPPTGPQYGWRQEPGPPGSPGPIWCLVPQASAPRQIVISPERYGWIRVLCDSEATPARLADVQRRLSAAGVYQGPVDGRYDLNTTAAVQRFQAQRHIEDRGYLSYATLSALSAYSETGYPRNSYAPAPYASAYPQTA